MDIWDVVVAVGQLAAVGVAAWAARQSRSSAREANAAAATLAQLERDRRHAELTPRLRVSCEPQVGGSVLRLRVMLLGPPGLDRLDNLTVTIRDDHFLRGAHGRLAGGLTQEQIKQQVWGPYRFTPQTGPGDARADHTGRVTACGSLPTGEELPFQLEPTTPPPWATDTSQAQWQQERGTMIRLAFVGRHIDHGSWTLPCEIDTAGDHDHVTVKLPQAQLDRA